MTHEQDSAAGDSMSDLVVRARTDREAFGLLYDAYYPKIFRYCLRRLFVQMVAEDATAEVFLRVAAKIRDFPGTTEEDFRCWLYRIATNEVNAHVRRAKRRRVLLEAAARQSMIADAAGCRQSPIDLLDWPSFYQAILGLNAREQTIIVLRFYEQMSHEQIAAVLAERPATVRAALSRALGKLRRKFELEDVNPVVKPGS
jgi:RNA polymerase sigma-70 factor, ECF subfamily